MPAVQIFASMMPVNILLSYLIEKNCHIKSSANFIFMLERRKNDKGKKI